MSVSRSIPVSAILIRVLFVCLLSIASVPVITVDSASASGVGHLVISEVMTGGTSANDELIELYNPSAGPLPLEGLELIYVSATGATVTRRAAWELGAAEIPPGAHLLVANQLGLFAPIADALYASGMAATGGSVAIRIQGASAAIDAVGWGSAASTWMEGNPAGAPASGASLERLPGGSAGSTVDTDNNAADFLTRSAPDPQNSGSVPVPDPVPPSSTPTPAPTDEPTPVPTITPLPTGSADPTPTPAPASVTIATARALPDGAAATIEAVALTGSDFADGGGYVIDDSGGIAVLLESGSFARGDRLRIRGTIDDRFAQRTLRSMAADVAQIGTGDGPAALASATGSVDESVEALLVEIAGTISGSPTTLSGGTAFDVDDGSGPVRVIVGTTTGIETGGWISGVHVRLVGVVGQRDSSGTGISGYRVQPRAPDDVEAVTTPTPTPSTSESVAPSPTATASPPAGTVISIADARAAARNSRVTVRGVVTLGSGTVERGSAVIQDGTGAILLRLGEDVRAVSRGELVEVTGVRSTKSGMESLRLAAAPRRLGTAADPAPRALRTGDAAEASEALLVVVRGAVLKAARRAESGSVTFDIDDGSGPIRIVLGPRLKANKKAFPAGTFVEVRGVLGQHTTVAKPSVGYRVWPRSSAEVSILAGPTDPSGVGSGSDIDAGGGADGGGSAVAASLEVIGAEGLAELRVGASLVSFGWPELGVGGLLWDGVRLVGIAPESGNRVEQIAKDAGTPLSLELVGLQQLRKEARPGIPLVRLSEDRSDTVIGNAIPVPPATRMPGSDAPPSWVSLIGRLTNNGGRWAIEVRGEKFAVERLCRRDGSLPAGVTNLVGVAFAKPQRVIVGCDGAQPAPALAALATSVTGPDAAALSALTRVDPDAVPAGGRRLAASALLIIGVVVLVLAVLLGRRYGPDDARVEDADDEPPVAPESPTPQLTLVRLPTEHVP